MTLHRIPHDDYLIHEIDIWAVAPERKSLCVAKVSH
jgi:hypothetical protein